MVDGGVILGERNLAINQTMCRCVTVSSLLDMINASEKAACWISLSSVMGTVKNDMSIHLSNRDDDDDDDEDDHPSNYSFVYSFIHPSYPQKKPLISNMPSNSRKYNN